MRYLVHQLGIGQNQTTNQPQPPEELPRGRWTPSDNKHREALDVAMFIKAIPSNATGYAGDMLLQVDEALREVGV